MYECGQLQLTWNEVSSQPIPSLLHRYFTTQDHPEIYPLVSSFQVHPDSASAWRIHATDYLFSAEAHISTFLRVIKERHLILNSNEREYQRLLNKIKGSSCEVGKYGKELAGLISQLDTLSTL